jgi:hypothetical protein
MTRERLLKLVEQLPNDGRPFAFAVWQRDDVVDYAMQSDIRISVREADAIIATMDRCHDAEVGLNWSIIEHHLNELVQHRKKRRRKLQPTHV